MTRTRHRHAAFLAAAAFGLPAPLHAREAHLVAGDTSAWVEIQGANGPILAPNSTFAYPYLPFAFSPYLSSSPTLLGVAADGTNGYFLVASNNFSTNARSESVWTYNLATGVRTATSAIQRPASDPGLSDIALLNGTLYVASGPTSPTVNGTTRVYSVGPAGALTSVYSRTDATAATPQIAANSQSNRVVLLPVGGPNYSPATNTPQVLLDPSNWSVAQSVAGTPAGQISLNLDGSRLAEYTSSGSIAFADTYTVPGFARISPQPSSFGQAGPTIGSATSDAFDYAYPSSSPAVFRAYLKGSGAPLFRTGEHSWQGEVAVSNYALPDNTAVDQVVATGLTWTQTYGPAVQTSTTFSPAGPMSTDRTFSQTTFTVDVTGAARDTYLVRGAVALQGHYTGPGTDATRPLSVAGTGPSAVYAVDPDLSNLVGNGDLELGGYGWSGSSTYDFDTKSSTLSFVTGSTPKHNSQSLELGTPHSPMMLSFDYNLDSSLYKALGGTADLTVTLAGIQIASVPGITGSPGTQHFSVYLSDPRLQDLSNPLLDFQAVTASGSISWLYVDNISLTAVPEPAGAFLLTLLPVTVAARRRHSR